MYVSLGFEDLEAVMGWVELRGGGAHAANAKRGGLGFDRGNAPICEYLLR